MKSLHWQRICDFISFKIKKSPAQPVDLQSFFFIKYPSKAQRDASSIFIMPDDSFPSLNGDHFLLMKHQSIPNICK